MVKIKKKYIKPAMQVYKIEPTTLLAGSPDPRGSLYDEIGFSDDYCTDPE
ncbi:MAG: hypothetical protein ACI3YJ_02470 [Prevotella sp.]